MYTLEAPEGGLWLLLCDFDLDISMHNTYRTTSMPDHVTLASSNREIWPFESPVTSTF